MRSLLGMAIISLFLVTIPEECKPKPTPVPTPTPDPCLGVHCPKGEQCQNGVCVPIPDPCNGITCAPGYTCSAGKCILTPTPPPVSSSCPKTLEPGAEIYLNNKRYGNGLDSTLRVRGDKEFCKIIHGVEVNDCHLEGWSKRSACEMELMNGCPIWFYSITGDKPTSQCHQSPHPIASCDHWGDPVDRDDPMTPEFEGRPFACGIQRDSENNPEAGFFIIAHAEPNRSTYFRACLPNGTNCGPWILGKDN